VAGTLPKVLELGSQLLPKELDFPYPENLASRLGLLDCLLEY
jgi:hypothetical protein